MPKVILDPVANPESQNSFVNTLNENFERIEEAFTNTLSRDGSIPNEMNANLDMNSNRIINVPVPLTAGEAASKAYVDSLNVEIVDIIQYVDQAEEAKDEAVSAALNASASAETANEYADIAVAAAGSVITGGFAYGQFTGNGMQQSYDLGLSIVTAERIIWSENGVIQEPYEDFTVSGTTVFRTTPPENGMNIFWVLLGGVRGEGIEFDVQVDELSDRAAYDNEPQGYRVLVSDVGDGRGAVYSKASNASADWTAPAYLTSSAGGGDVMGPVSSLNSSIPIFGDTSGTVLEDSGVLLSNITPMSLTFIIDGGGDTITTGVKGDLTIPFNCTITEWTLLSDQSGSVVIDVWKDTLANAPPVNADSITASAPPTLSAAVAARSSTLTGWTTSVTAGDILRFNVDSVTSLERVTLSLKALRT